MNVNPFNVTDEIVSILMADARIARIVRNKVFPIVAPHNTPGSFIVYQRDGYKQQDTKTGVAVRQPLVVISCVADRYVESQQLASLVYETLSGRFVEPCMEIRLEDSTEDFIDKKFMQVLQFSVTI